jgi:Fanconi anemia group M protein
MISFSPVRESEKAAGRQRPMPYSIVIDDRERVGGLASALTRLLGQTPVVRRLTLGDIAIGDRLVIERKTVADFAASWRDGRLTDQLARLTAHARDGKSQCLMIVEGLLASDATPGVHIDEIRLALLSVQVDWRLPLIRASDAEETALWVALLARRLETGRPALGTDYRRTVARLGPPPQAHRRPTLTPQGPDGVQLAALGQIPGLGRKKARVLLERFGTIHALRLAGRDAWISLPGIGAKLADALSHYFQRQG